ncbi:extracellular ribonuclease LE-like [Durio zibethinus]|uniref:Extracellular ribonuclease LE-like n=1 Tax=Durio zibethinus TaxID=66656 RepID=A0A6P5X8J8_DURZI|nr:extracellular ribonuclease LE-like [Durio zibethinus]
MRQKHLLTGALVAGILAAISLLPPRGNIEFSFYKLSFRWPPSACNVGTLKCLPDTLGYFTIHGLWPTYADDTEVPRYDPKKNKCTDVTPVDPKNLLPELKNIEDTLQKCWPNYKNYKNINMCAESWKHEWVYHGICSDYAADKPLEYFSAALTFAKEYEYDPLKGTNVQPREEPYEAQEIINAVKAKVGKTPQIQCNKNGETLQLLEIRLCFEKNKSSITPRDCPKTFTPDGLCQKETDQIKITPPPKVDLLGYKTCIEAMNEYESVLSNEL